MNKLVAIKFEDDIVKLSVYYFSRLPVIENKSKGFHNNGGYIQDDRGVYQRQCSGNLGCSPQDNNRWNNPRKHGYAKGRNSNGSSNGQVCGQRVEHFRDYSETLHLSCNGDVLYVTRHRK